MDFLKIRSFVKDLTYDLDSVQYLFDYGRVKETLPIIETILNNIDSFRVSNLGTDLANVFSEDFWNKKLPADMSLSKMRAAISQYSHAKSPLIEEDLDKIEYTVFVKNIFNWSDKNISSLRNAAKSPLHQKIEKRILHTLEITTGLVLIVILGQMFLTKDWGLTGDFYTGKFDKYLYSGHKKTIDFSAPEEMDSRLPNDYFSARWKGSLLAPKDGEYTIGTTSDDGVKVFIDEKLLISDWIQHSAKESFNKIFLHRGAHLITIEYYQLQWSAVLKLFWAMDGGKKEIIPAQYLRH